MTNKIKGKSFTLFKQYFMYLIFYSVGGFIVERVINVIFLGEWYDNSVLIGPYQPLYGSGIVLTIFFYNRVYMRLKGVKELYKEISLIVAAIFFTALVEAITGWGYEWLYHIRLWNYGDFFVCKYPYVCSIPTTLFGILSYLVVKYLHPNIHFHLERTSNVLFYILFSLFIMDIIYTFSIL